MSSDYHDIVSWTEEFEPADQYDDFQEWDKAVKSNFEKHGHYFPPAMTDTLAEFWEEKYEELADASQEEAVRYNDQSEYGREKSRQQKSNAQFFNARAVSASREIVRRRKISEGKKRHSRALMRERSKDKRLAERRRISEGKQHRRLSRSERKRRGR